MPKKAWLSKRDLVVNKLLKLLDETYDYRQDHYKELFFRIFSTAFDNGFCIPRRRYDESRERYVRCASQRPQITGEFIGKAAKSFQWSHRGRKPKKEIIQEVSTWWDEWTYAWKQISNPNGRRPKRLA